MSLPTFALLMKFGDIVENLEITGISSEGKSIGRHDGLVVFVKDGVPGDLADVQITHKRRRFVEGQIHKLHESSPYPTSPASGGRQKTSQ